MALISNSLQPFAAAVAAVLIFAGGCGGGPPLQRAKGQILVDGKNYSVGPREQLQVIFFPDVELPANTYPAEVKSDGSFETVGMDGRGIPPGKYRISISSPYGGGSVSIPTELGSATSPIVREIVMGQETVAPIDIARPAG
jgi:hypothetical protein